MGKFNISNQQDFQKIKEEAENFYEEIDEVYCPYFKEKIVFNTKGLRHLKFKSNRKARTMKDQYPRLKLLHFAPEILKLSHTIQGIWKTKTFEEYKADSTNNKWARIMKDVIFYEFIAVLDAVRVKVIVKQVFGREKYFWSVIPFWGINKSTSKRVLHSGNPEHD
ncbi:MAG: hypothetical protein HQ539_01320 [Parcubacteria group bacterium]|nr:hypothetical protein [Parcubacteria group bacterium]